VNPFDKLPGENFRDQRYTKIYESLCHLGEDVHWWSMDFHHWSHSPRFSDKFNGNIRLFSVPKYKSNISLKRFFCYFWFSLKVYRELTKLEEPPEYIITLPVPELIFLLAKFCKSRNVKLIIDITDVWPDLYVRAFPKKLMWLGEILVKPFHWMANYAYKYSYHITAVSKTYRDEISDRSGVKNKKSSYFYLGAPQLTIDLDSKPIDMVNVIFVGQFEFSYDLTIIMQTALRSQNEGLKIRFFLAGRGSKMSFIEQFIKSNSLDNVELLGWLNSKDLMSIASRCHIGLNCYNSFATQSIPTKYFDYMSMGLVVLNSLEGEMADLIRSDASGLTYRANNVEDFYEKLLFLSSDIEKLKIEGVNNRHNFEKNYSFSKIYGRMVSLLFE
tara:strand:- start:711 stop:1868 length:1158 start_codon:yes stop_codon:yes gene_type:complete